jgi:hypothetical protein
MRLPNRAPGRPCLCRGITFGPLVLCSTQLGLEEGALQ